MGDSCEMVFGGRDAQLAKALCAQMLREWVSGSNSTGLELRLRGRLYLGRLLRMRMAKWKRLERLPSPPRRGIGWPFLFFALWDRVSQWNKWPSRLETRLAGCARKASRVAESPSRIDCERLGGPSRRKARETTT